MSGGTHAARPRAPGRFDLRDSHPLRWPVPAAFGQRPVRARRDCRPLRRARPTPARQRRQPPDAARVWAPPRSLAATEGILSFPRGTEMFQFPRCPPVPGYPAERRVGCPIRRPPDRRPPAPPWGVSPRGHVLRRPPTPRHPPCAHHRGHSPAIAAPRLPSKDRQPDRRALEGSRSPARSPTNPIRFEMREHRHRGRHSTKFR